VSPSPLVRAWPDLTNKATMVLWRSLIMNVLDFLRLKGWLYIPKHRTSAGEAFFLMARHFFVPFRETNPFAKYSQIMRSPSTQLVSKTELSVLP